MAEANVLQPSKTAGAKGLCQGGHAPVAHLDILQAKHLEAITGCRQQSLDQGSDTFVIQGIKGKVQCLKHGECVLPQQSEEGS